MRKRPARRILNIIIMIGITGKAPAVVNIASHHHTTQPLNTIVRVPAERPGHHLPISVTARCQSEQLEKQIVGKLGA